MRIHVLVNVHRTDAVEAAASAVLWLREKGVEVGADADSAKLLAVDKVDDADFADADLVVTFGGDGTLIRGADLCSQKGTPILGVFYGRFGFVTQCQGAELKACLQDFVEGKRDVSPRMMIQTDLIRRESCVASLHSLNEMVLQRSPTARMLTFKITVDDQVLTAYPADGIMVSTPTGSTAYNLSAGGPILDPHIQGFLITAIAPHTLSARTLILSPDSEVCFQITTEGDAVLSADGISRLHLLSEDEVRVRRSPRITNLLKVDKNDFLVKLHERLFWSKVIGGMP